MGQPVGGVGPQMLTVSQERNAIILFITVLIMQSDGFHHKGLIYFHLHRKNIKCPLKSNRASKDISQSIVEILQLCHFGPRDFCPSPIWCHYRITARVHYQCLLRPLGN